jgi:dihydroorotate dehydrogenase
VLPYADYLAVNISSPNTPGLRALQGGDYLGALLRELRTENLRLSAAQHVEPRPLLVKIAPDLTPDEVGTIVDVAIEQGMAGIIATNTTRSREGLSSPLRDQEGGMSGAPLKAMSTNTVARIAHRAQGRLVIIAVGGVSSGADVQEKLDAGAKLVQMYTGLVYEGPGVAGRVLRDLRTNP